MQAAWYGASLAIVTFLGGLNVYMPFAGDQAFFLFVAKALEQGQTLYSTLWDNKMPALFWFYLLAGKAFGFTAELLYLLVFSGVLMWALRRELAFPWLSAIAPLAVVGVYYASVMARDMTMLEILVGFPIFLSLWFATRCRPGETRAWLFALASGLLAGVVVTFKLVYAPVLVVAWVVVGLHYWACWPEATRGRETFLRLLKIGALPVTAGVVLVVGAVVVVFWRQGGLAELLWTAFDYPPLALEEFQKAPLYRLAGSMGYFVTYYFAWLGFIVVAVIHWWRTERSPLVSVLIVWLAVMVPLILIQRFSWWEYHALNLFAPAGLLGVKGLSVVLSWVVRNGALRRGAAALLALALCVPTVGALSVPVHDKIKPILYTFVKYDGDLLSYQSLYRPDYRLIFESTRFLRRPGAHPGDLFVFGTPMYYHFARRNSPGRIQGFSWSFLLQQHWRELRTQLEEQAYAYIYIEKDAGKYIARRHQPIWQHVSDNYRALTSDHDGVWFRRLN